MGRSAITKMFLKDVKLELRSMQNLYGIMVYAISTIFLLYLASGQPDSAQWNALFWITQLFIVVNAVVKSFVGESKGRFLYFAGLCHPNAYLGSKMLLNILYMMILSTVSVLLFSVFLGNPMVNVWLFVGISLLGGIGFALVFTMLSAIASKAQQQPSLIAILGFPVIIPQFILLIRLSKAAFGEVFKTGAVLSITSLLAGLNILVLIMALILFQYLWKD